MVSVAWNETESCSSSRSEAGLAIPNFGRNSVESSEIGVRASAQSRLISVIVPLRELAWGALLASGISASLLWIFLVSPMMGPAIQDLKAPIHTALGLSVVSALLLSALHRRLSRP